MILLIDNYDSFVYNLARYVSELGFEKKVIRNDALGVNEIAALNPSKIIISPGPCDPSKSGISLDVIKTMGSSTPILGVCLGHQAIGQVFGANIIRAKKPIHGKGSWVEHNQQGIFENIPSPFKVGRYHSLIVSNENFPDSLSITARSEEGEIMALSHKHYPVYGVQFHPESVITQYGYVLLKNFLYDK